MSRNLEQFSNGKPGPAAEACQPYCLAWRRLPSLPWRQEVLSNRFKAHSRYLSLIARGIEARLELRATVTHHS